MENELINESDFIFYNGEDGRVHAQVIVGDETVWVSQKTMGEIFSIQANTINYHLSEIYKSDELNESSTTRKIRVVQKEGTRDVNREIEFYNLEAIIAVGYRVNTYNATKFRQWATRILKEYLVKGFVLDDERLKQGNKLFGKDYFRELLERIRQIRASERMFYDKITDLYATSVDYDKKSQKTQRFFSHVQNKLEFAITGMTSAEIIKSRADSKMPNMGLTTWKEVNRDGRIQKTDVRVAKNYLNSDEMTKLNLISTMFLDYAESIVLRTPKIMKMSDWSSRLDKFLEFSEYEILNDFGKVKRSVADSFAEKQFDKFEKIQDRKYNSDFNKFVENIKVNKLATETDMFASNIIPQTQNDISNFDKKLIQALNYSPIEKVAKSRTIKIKTKSCPICGKELNKDAMYCDGYVEIDDLTSIPCSYVYDEPKKRQKKQ